MKVEAVVLAGATNKGRLADVSDAAHEALIPVCGRPMIHYVFDALRATSGVNRIVAVGPEGPLKEAGNTDGIEIVPAKATMVENLRTGVEALNPKGQVLIVTSDIPLIRAEIFDDFLSQCQKVHADIYYPIVRKETNEQKFPGVKRTYVRLKDGVFTGGNMALLHPEVVPACEGMITQAIAMRKKPWQLSRLLGFIFILKLLSNQLTLAEIEERVETLLGFRGVGVESPHPEVGIDVDKPEDLKLVEAVLKERL